MRIEKNKWIVVISVICIVGIALIIQPPAFYFVDDIIMRSILSGAYSGTPDGHAVYMQYPLTGVLAWAYKICNAVPWLELFFIICIVVGMSLIALQFKRPVIGILVSFLVYMPFYQYIHYTLIAALMGATAVFLLMQGRYKVWPIILLLFAYMIRSQVGLLSLPFVACALVWKIIIRPRDEWKRAILTQLKWVFCVGTVLLLCTIINRLCYNSEEWKSYLAYNDSRTLLFDYTDFMSTDYYGQHFDSFAMTKQEHIVLTSYNLMLDSNFDEVKMQQVAEAVVTRMSQNPELGNPLTESVKNYYIQMRFKDIPYNYVWLVTYIVLIVSFIVYKKWLPFATLVVLGIGRSSIWMYLIWKGRFPERVSLSLYLLELMVLLGMSLYLTQHRRISQVKFQKLASWILVGALLITCGWQWKDTQAKMFHYTQFPPCWTVIKKYCSVHPERLYLMDVYSGKDYSDYTFVKDADNIKYMGGWMSASPLTNQIFENLEVKDAAEALYFCEEVSFLAGKERDVLWLEEYLCERFGECTLVEVGTIKWPGGPGFVEYVVQK